MLSAAADGDDRVPCAGIEIKPSGPVGTTPRHATTTPEDEVRLAGAQRHGEGHAAEQHANHEGGDQQHDGTIV